MSPTTGSGLATAVLTATLIAGAALAPTAFAQTATPAAQTPPPPIPLRDFFRNIDRGYYRLSADGKTLGFMQPAIGDDGKSQAHEHLRAGAGRQPPGG